jgi:hypothetical protein
LAFANRNRDHPARVASRFHPAVGRGKFEDKRIEVRLGYYIIGKKPKMRGRWVWDQFAALLPLRDFRALI